MQHLLTPTSTRVEPFVWWEGGFSEEELDILQAKAVAAKGEPKVGADRTDFELRRTAIDWIDNDSEFGWVFNRLSKIVSDLNAQYFNFNLTGFGEPLQLGNYTEEEQGTYGWHQDFGDGPSRKLTLILQLSDPADYEGGNLELLTAREPFRLRKQRGLVILFPCWTLHRVTPVVRGARQTLVTWISGNPFV